MPGGSIGQAAPARGEDVVGEIRARPAEMKYLVPEILRCPRPPVGLVRMSAEIGARNAAPVRHIVPDQVPSTRAGGIPLLRSLPCCGER